MKAIGIVQLQARTFLTLAPLPKGNPGLYLCIWQPREIISQTKLHILLQYTAIPLQHIEACVDNVAPNSEVCALALLLLLILGN